MMKQNSLEIDYRSLFENMPDGVAYCQMLFDNQNHPVDFVFIEANKNYEKLTGMKGTAGRKVTELIPNVRTSSPEVFEVCGRVALTGRPEKFEIYVKTLKRWFSIAVYCPKKGYFTALVQNINSRKQVEKNLEEAKIAARNVLKDLQVEKETLAHEKAKDEAMLASIGDGVIIVDLTGKITFMNLSAQNLLGWKTAEIMDQFLFDIVPIEDEKGNLVSATARPMTASLTIAKEYSLIAEAEAMTRPGMYYYMRKDRTKFPVAMTFSRVMLEGKIIGGIEVFRDVTREKEIDLAKTEFVSLASHQLKTPPTAIKLLTERILNGRVGPLTEKQKEYFGDIRSSNQRMIDLVNTLLSVSRIEMGTFSILPSIKDIPVVMRNIVSELKLSIDNKKLKLQLVVSEKNIMLLIDEPLFHMVMNNLLTNAINYTPEGGTIRVECQKMFIGQTLGGKQLKEDCLAVIIADTGYGVPKNQQSKIFTKFFRADNAREKHTDGNGLGLYIVKSVLDHSDGSIWFISEENKGSTFYVAIPTTGMRAVVGEKQLVN